MTHLTLVGGGWTAGAAADVYGPFVRAAGGAEVAVVLVDEGDGEAKAQQWADVLGPLGATAVRPVLVPLGGRLDVASLDGAGALLVGGGLTPAYADALAPAADELRDWLADRPYCGFSAGAAAAARRAVVGGWRDGATPVCAEDTGEDLDQLSVVDGLGLLEEAVDVHAAQWGTLARLLTAVRTGRVETGFAVDEDTALVVEDDARRVVGRGQVHLVSRDGDALRVRQLRAG